MSIPVEEVPAMQSLAEFASKLPVEHRAQLYKTIEQFLDIGVGHGVMVGALDTSVFGNATSKPESDKQTLYKEYLQKKAAEAAAVLKLKEQPN